MAYAQGLDRFKSRVWRWYGTEGTERRRGEGKGGGRMQWRRQLWGTGARAFSSSNCVDVHVCCFVVSGLLQLKFIVDVISHYTREYTGL